MNSHHETTSTHDTFQTTILPVSTDPRIHRSSDAGSPWIPRSTGRLVVLNVLGFQAAGFSPRESSDPRTRDRAGGGILNPGNVQERSLDPRVTLVSPPPLPVHTSSRFCGRRRDDASIVHNENAIEESRSADSRNARSAELTEEHRSRSKATEPTKGGRDHSKVPIESRERRVLRKPLRDPRDRSSADRNPSK